MSEERNEAESFFSRWSRVKTETREAAVQPPAPTVAKESEEAPPALPPIEKLTIDSDFSGFFHPKVDEDVRRSALKKLFTDPHFNTMDMMDVYVDDYSKTEPIPAAMLASLKQAQRIFDWAAGKDDTLEEKPAEESIADAPAEPAPAALEAQSTDTPNTIADAARVADPRELP